MSLFPKKVEYPFKQIQTLLLVHLAIPVTDSEGHAWRNEQQQRFLFAQFLPEAIQGFPSFTHSLNARWETINTKLTVC